METQESTPQSGQQWRRYGVVGGLLAASLTAVSYWQTGAEVSLTPVVFVALVVGYATRRRSVYDGRIGARVGLIGGFPIVWASYDFVGFAVGVSTSSWFSAASVVLLGVFTLFGLGASTLFGWIAARLGRWLADRSGRSRPVARSHS